MDGFGSFAPVVDATNSPLTDDQARALDPVLKGLSGDQLTWLSGFALGLKQGRGQPLSLPGEGGTPADALATVAARPKLTVLYASQTGNSEGAAHRAGEAGVQAGFDVSVKDVADYKLRQLKEESYLLVVASTHGEGDAPDSAADFHEGLHSKKAPKLASLHYSVLGLGDSSYEYFCQVGKDIDRRLEALGGQRIHPRVDCDLDYEEKAEEWARAAVGALAQLALPENAGVAPAPAGMENASQASGTATVQLFSRKNPYMATLLTNQQLTGRGSDKDTRHIELSIDGSGLVFEPGDSLGVYPTNDASAVQELLEAAGLDPEAPVPGPQSGGEAPLREALMHYYEITTLTPPFLNAWAARAGSEMLNRLVHDDAKSDLRAWMHGRQVIDVLETFPVPDLEASEFVGMLRRLPPRFYSIASSHTANPDEVHLTVAPVRYDSHGRSRYGVASTWLADRISDDDPVPVFIDHNKNFKPPRDAATPIIMIGPGTGVAPFRAFLEEREAAETAHGPAWLFFGERRFRTDFLYQTDWQRWLDRGILDRLDVAFSRDGEQKVYVQDRLRANGAAVWQWLADGAHVYVCGDADNMAPDVHEALIDIAVDHGRLPREDATVYIKQLQKERRYQRDVY